MGEVAHLFRAERLVELVETKAAQREPLLGAFQIAFDLRCGKARLAHHNAALPAARQHERASIRLRHAAHIRHLNARAYLLARVAHARVFIECLFATLQHAHLERFGQRERVIDIVGVSGVSSIAINEFLHHGSGIGGRGVFVVQAALDEHACASRTHAARERLAGTQERLGASADSKRVKYLDRYIVRFLQRIGNACHVGEHHMVERTRLARGKLRLRHNHDARAALFGLTRNVDARAFERRHARALLGVHRAGCAKRITQRSDCRELFFGIRLTARANRASGVFKYAGNRDSLRRFDEVFEILKSAAFFAKQCEACLFINKAIAANGSREVERRTLAHARKRVQREIGSGSNIDAIGGAQCGGALKRAAKIGRSEWNARPTCHRDVQRAQRRRNSLIERTRVARSNAHGFADGHIRNKLGEQCGFSISPRGKRESNRDAFRSSRDFA